MLFLNLLKREKFPFLFLPVLTSLHSLDLPLQKFSHRISLFFFPLLLLTHTTHTSFSSHILHSSQPLPLYT
ncbi:hypothetical protein ASPWEDRAFT_274599 [Aspergillus wentii DTO 134E9]|uniref:Uncharacterized protein n=1 Tax=Aspergillus wentii DTO 134E9 TaxID=1073089 RepID=A0A1L9S344_ASPWE|nr:uncharacterized protein ASPWEDRAFT_274599 [Aspergillus wentii DTO 134E9]OJJ41582.1 hypothetical protein ASPWEDRAFT_274599 [Aspergillus wentii DTO 134E9]